MLELPEVRAMARQLQGTVVGRRIAKVEVLHSPHKFAFVIDAGEQYPALLEGRTIESAQPVAGYVRLALQDSELMFFDGVNLRFLPPGSTPPEKHQFLAVLDDGSMLSASVQMYGGIFAVPTGTLENVYFEVARTKPTPYDSKFNRAYFTGIYQNEKPNLSAKALLATEQRIPGLGNGVLQDILFSAGIHPKRKLATLTQADMDTLFDSIKTTLVAMDEGGGRDNEKDLFGNPGGYATQLTAKTTGKPCPRCGTPIEKAAYLGGNVYFCPVCQPL